MVNIGISETHRKAVSERLNLLLANEYVLYTKTLKYHWNVEGRHFGALHIFFREQYEQLFDIIDLVAERARALGFNSYGTLQEFSQKTTLREDPGMYPNDLEMIEILLLDQEAVIRQMREDIDFTLESNDIGTNNFLTDLMERHEKMAWMLRAHLVND
jgi:starvation-inducible DNA-binding protein